MKTKTGRTLKVAAGVLLAGVLATVGVASAEAATENVTNTQAAGTLVYGSNIRYHPTGSVSFRLDYVPECLGGSVNLGLFHNVSQGQVTSTLVNNSLGVTKYFTNLQGNGVIDAGYYGIDSRLVGGCGGTWGGLFTY